MYNITLALLPGQKQPMYQQLYRYLAGEIQRGGLVSGAKLPSKRALCQSLGVSRSTVENAYAALLSEGYVRAVPRSGFYVADYTCPLAAPAPPPAEEEDDAPAAQAPAVDFSTATVDTSVFPYASWAKLNREVVYASPELLQRGDRQGEPSLRRALAALLEQYRGVRCRPGQIIIGAGMEYLTELLIQLLPRDTVFALEDPGYTATYASLRNSGRRVCLIPVDGCGMDAAALSGSDASVAYVTPSHQFPLGVTMPAGRRSQLLYWSSSKPGRYIIEDDYDSEFRHSSRPVQAMQGTDGGGRVVYVGTFSRSLAPSIRIAYMVLPDELLRRGGEMFGAFSSTVSRYEQTVMARFIREGYYSRYLRRVGNLYRQRCALLTRLLCEAFPDAVISGAGGGIHLLLTLPGRDGEELRRRAAARGIYLHGLGEYCRECPPLPGTVVLGYGGVEDASLPRAVALLREAWSADGGFAAQ